MIEIAPIGGGYKYSIKHNGHIYNSVVDGYSTIAEVKRIAASIVQLQLSM